MPDINEGQPWSQQDDVDLRNEVTWGMTIERVADFLCRPVGEVLKRAAELGLRWDGTSH